MTGWALTWVSVWLWQPEGTSESAYSSTLTARSSKSGYTWRRHPGSTRKSSVGIAAGGDAGLGDFIPKVPVGPAHFGDFLGLGPLDGKNGELDFDVAYGIEPGSFELANLFTNFLNTLTLDTMAKVLKFSAPGPELRKASVQLYHRTTESDEPLFKLAAGVPLTTQRHSSVNTYRLKRAWTLADRDAGGHVALVRRKDCEALGLGFDRTAQSVLHAAPTSTTTETLATTTTVAVQPPAAQYRTLHDSRYGFSCDVPIGYRAIGPPAQNGDGFAYERPVGYATVVCSGSNNIGTSSANAKLDEEASYDRDIGRTVTYSSSTGNAITISGTNDVGEIFYDRLLWGPGSVNAIRWEYSASLAKEIEPHLLHTNKTLKAGDLIHTH